MKREIRVVFLEIPTRAEVLKYGKLAYNGWKFKQDAIYIWQGRQWIVAPRRGKPRPMVYECEQVQGTLIKGW